MVNRFDLPALSILKARLIPYLTTQVILLTNKKEQARKKPLVCLPFLFLYYFTNSL